MDLNPYASPQEPNVREPLSGAGIGVWADKHSFIMHEDATLPPICVKTGRPAECYVPVRFSRGIPFVSRRTFTIHVPITKAWEWRRQKLAPWLLVLGVIFSVPIILLIALGVHSEWPILGFLMLAAPLLFSGLAFRSLLVPVKFRGRYCWFGGSCRRFRLQLPRWCPLDRV